MCSISLVNQINVTLGSAPSSSADDNPSQIAGTDTYEFNGDKSLTAVTLMTDSVKEAIMNIKDHFSVSFWMNTESKVGNEYIYSIEDGSEIGRRDRYFSLLVWPDRLNVFYLRDRLPNIDPNLSDIGIGTRVGLSFYVNTEIYPITEGKWHYVKLDVDYPKMMVYFDGYLIQATEGHYFGINEAKVDLNTDSSFDMPAPIWNDAVPSNFIGRIGGSRRNGGSFNFKGKLRLLFVTSPMDNSQYSCIASCNNSLAPPEYTPGTNDFNVSIGEFDVFYQPVSRVLYFSYANGNVSLYDSFLKSLVYESNGYLPPQELLNAGEGRRIDVQIADEVGFGSVSQVTIHGRANENRPIVKALLVPDDQQSIDYSTSFFEESDDSVFIVAPNAIFSDDDLDSVIVNVTITLLNPQLSQDVEYLSVETNLLSVEQSAHEISFVGTLATNNPIYVTSLLSVKYHNDADEPDGTPRQIEISVFDGKFFNLPLTQVTINVITFDDPPIIEPSGDVGNTVITVEYNEGVGKDDVDFLAPDMAVRDSDSPDLVSGLIYLEEVFDTGMELLFIDTSLLQGTGVECDPVDCEGTALTLTGDAPPSVYQSIYRSLKYVNLKQISDFPSLFDRKIKLSVDDGNNQSSSDVEIIVDVIPFNQRVIIDLDTPNHNYFINYTEDSGANVPIVGNSRVVDISLATLQNIQINLRDPELEEGEKLTLDIPCITALKLGAENLQSIQQILIGSTSNVTTEDFRKSLDCITYRNTENEPVKVTRYIDFLFIPGGGAPNDTATTEINFLYMNDNAPVCEDSSNLVDFIESTEIGEVFHTFQATDIDVGPGDNDVGYEFISGNNLDMFNLSTVDGVAMISLKVTVDFESDVLQYPVTIEACDMGTPALCCQYNITFILTDANDNPPRFVNEPIIVNVNENMEMLLTTFVLDDNDSGINAQLFSLEIESASPIGCQGSFETNLSPPTLSTVNGGIDFESTPVCYVIIVAKDAGDPQQSASTNVTVNAVDQDDKPPVFLGPFNFNVPENNSVPFVIGTVEAMDPDSDDNTLVFSLVNSDPTLFSIDASTGELSILFTVDLSIAVSYTVTVKVEDPAGNSDTQIYTITVTPVNNDPPSLVLNSQPVAFTEESGLPVTLQSNPVITDPDEVGLSIDKIYVTVANGEDATKEILSVKADAPGHTIGTTSDPFEIVILPANQENISEVISLIQSIQYLNTEDEPSACRSDKFTCSSDFSRTILVSVSDSMFVSNKEEAIVNFAFVNDAPEIDLDISGERLIEYKEGDAPAQIVNSLAYKVSDDDDETLQSLSCTLSNALDGTDESLLFIGNIPAGLSLSGNNSHFVTVTGSSIVDNYRTVLAQLYYYGISSNPDTSIDRVVSCVVSDSAKDSVPATATITYKEVNDIPHVLLNPTSINYQEEMGKVLIANNPVITDVDNTNLSSLTVSLLDVSGPEHSLSLDIVLPEDLTAILVPGFITVFGVATIDTYATVLQAVSYENTLIEFPVLQTFTIQVVVVDNSNGSSAPADVEITLVSVDDNPPEFAANVFEVLVSETLAVGTIFFNFTVIDNDLPIPETPIFSIIGDVLGNFQITNSLDNNLLASLSIKSQLDFDVVEAYILAVQVVSGNFTGSTNIVISVINENNKDVYFQDFPNSFEVFESNENSLPLNPSSVLAIDPDGFSITYTISSLYVSINASTGELATVPPIDRESVPGVSFTITISATDGLSTVTEEANVTVLDMNEFAPKFSNDMYNATIEENSSPISPIVTVSASDADEAPDFETEGTKITYALLASNFSSYFSLDITTGELYLLNSLDYEETNEIKLEIAASDNVEFNPMVTIVPVTIYVSDINDESPYFVNFPSLYLVKEAPLTQFDLTILGDDPDMDNVLMYNLTSNIPDLPFTINMFNGKVMLSSDIKLDADNGIREYPITVILKDLATDEDYPSMISENLTIIVQDVNDNAPQFQQNQYSVSVTENKAISQVGGDPVLTVQAVDSDYGFDHMGLSNGNNNVTYSLSSAPVDTFRIDPVTGTIYILKPLDREDIQSFLFFVIASDNPISELPDTNMVAVTVTVLDVNEHPPVADPSEYFVTVDESVADGTELETYVSVEWSTTGNVMSVYIKDKIVYFIMILYFSRSRSLSETNYGNI